VRFTWTGTSSSVSIVRGAAMGRSFTGCTVMEMVAGAELILLPGVSHFAPLQRPEQFNRVLSTFLGNVLA